MNQKEKGLIPIDDWKFNEVEHLATMGFDFNSDFYMQTNKEPEMKVYKKNEIGPDGKEKSFFYLEEPKRAIKKFPDFNDLIDFFDNYSQPSIDKNT